jgi:hypothetical protein
MVNVDQFVDCSDNSECDATPCYAWDVWWRLIKGQGQIFKDAKAFRRAIVICSK